MRHANALLIKFLMVAVILFLVLTLGIGVSVFNVLIFSAILSLLAYFIGDLQILRHSNNITATIADFALYAIGIWLLGTWLLPPIAGFIGAGIIAAVFISVGEWFFHRFMGMFIFIGELESTNVLQTEDDKLVTEFAEDEEIEKAIKEKEEE
ncbi:DUF2512 family protein [Bacillus sp. FJAT-45350]|uniref:DUF2512 family protein n=1 Tax=Bacillus sp. FJAT-45350 TaxID=2011014 RepID=UPI000BB6A742|nr:DUF2512 family protein [Bacillus sp. FJAT-45350]